MGGQYRAKNYGHFQTKNGDQYQRIFQLNVLHKHMRAIGESEFYALISKSNSLDTLIMFFRLSEEFSQVSDVLVSNLFIKFYDERRLPDLLYIWKKNKMQIQFKRYSNPIELAQIFRKTFFLSILLFDRLINKNGWAEDEKKLYYRTLVSKINFTDSFFLTHFSLAKFTCKYITLDTWKSEQTPLLEQLLLNYKIPGVTHFILSGGLPWESERILGPIKYYGHLLKSIDEICVTVNNKALEKASQNFKLKLLESLSWKSDYVYEHIDEYYYLVKAMILYKKDAVIELKLKVCFERFLGSLKPDPKFEKLSFLLNLLELLNAIKKDSRILRFARRIKITDIFKYKPNEFFEKNNVCHHVKLGNVESLIYLAPNKVEELNSLKSQQLEECFFVGDKEIGRSAITNKWKFKNLNKLYISSKGLFRFFFFFYCILGRKHTPFLVRKSTTLLSALLDKSSMGIYSNSDIVLLHLLFYYLNQEPKPHLKRLMMDKDFIGSLLSRHRDKKISFAYVLTVYASLKKMNYTGLPEFRSLVNSTNKAPAHKIFPENPTPFAKRLTRLYNEL